MRTSDIELENELFKSVYEKTPDYIKNLNLIDFSQDGEFTFTLKKEHLKPYDKDKKKDKLRKGVPIYALFRSYDDMFTRKSYASSAGDKNINDTMYIHKLMREAKKDGLSVYMKPIITLEDLKMEGKKVINNKELECMELALITAYKPIGNIEGRIKPYVFRK